jgi:hypothetical protein
MRGGTLLNGISILGQVVDEASLENTVTMLPVTALLGFETIQSLRGSKREKRKCANLF